MPASVHIGGWDVANMRDASAKGQLPRGERHHASKLTDAQRAEIASRFVTGSDAASLAREFGVTPKTIYCTVKARGVVYRALRTFK